MTTLSPELIALHQPHPERASEALLGSNDGLTVFQSVLQAVVQA